MNNRNPRIDKLKENGHWKAMGKIDPQLRGVKAFNHPSVQEWHEWIIEEYSPNHEIILITPCSNRKPYPKSPQSSKIRGILRRHGLWDPEGRGYKGSPKGIEWIYLSDLLLLVPYDKATEYPACCYDLPPDQILREPQLLNMITRKLSWALAKLRNKTIITYLPVKHQKIIKTAINGKIKNIIQVKYHLFHGHKKLEKTITTIIKQSK